MEAFPNSVVWGNTNNGQGYDLVLMGQLEPIKIDVDAMQARLMSPQLAPVAQSLGEVGFNGVIDLLSTYAGRGPELAPWLRDAELNRDRNLRLQFLAGMGNNSYQGGPIYSEMLTYRTYPSGLFAASDEIAKRLSEVIGR
jgi:spermidine synthase